MSSRRGHSPSAQRSPRWRHHRRLTRSRLPNELRDWLLDPASLTQRLRDACPGGFSVRVVNQGWERPRLDEARVLGLDGSERGLVRQVQLLCHGEPWVFARTIIPSSTLTGAERRLAHLGNRPLGAVLFADPRMHRDPVEVSRMVPGQDLFETATAGMEDRAQEIWGRRSVFYLGRKPLLVSEIFLTRIGPCGRHHWR